MLEAGTLLVTTDDGGHVIGVVGLEAHGEQTLLRSLAVEPRWRGQGAGRALVAAALAVSSTDEVWLLTETAEQFLAGCGFRAVARAEVVGPVTESFEWRHACPASATAMTWRDNPSIRIDSFIGE
jgi:N-acetylglutamate synthase-like GNAT family acetyltransferase